MSPSGDVRVRSSGHQPATNHGHSGRQHHPAEPRPWPGERGPRPVPARHLTQHNLVPGPGPREPTMIRFRTSRVVSLAVLALPASVPTAAVTAAPAAAATTYTITDLGSLGLGVSEPSAQHAGCIRDVHVATAHSAAESRTSDSRCGAAGPL